MTPLTSRTGADRCPGALRPFAAEDGLIVRVRIPGGEISVAALDALMGLATSYGAPQIQVTTRANLQIRGLPDPLPAEVVDGVQEAGLLPSLTHERARNIVASPVGARQRARARELDARLRSRPALAGLPGRFLMLLTEASGLGLSLPYDVAHIDEGAGAGLLVAGGRGRSCPVDAAYDAMLDLASHFLALRADERVWNIRDLPAGSPVLDGFEPVDVSVADPLVPGPHGRDLVAGVPDGLLRPVHVEALRSVTGSLTGSVVVTPWRSLLIDGGAAYAAVLAEAGFACR